MKQLGLAFQQYTQDFDERFPLRVSSGTPAGFACNEEDTWSLAIYPYLKNDGVFQCPSDDKRASGGYCKPAASDQTVSYSDYAYYLQFARSNGQAVGKALSAVNYPAMTVLLVEGSTDSRNQKGFFMISAPDAGGTTQPELAAVTSGDLQRHFDGANFLFADGHVKWYKSSSNTESAAVWDDDLTESTNPKVGTVPSFLF